MERKFTTGVSNSRAVDGGAIQTQGSGVLSYIIPIAIFLVILYLGYRFYINLKISGETYYQRKARIAYENTSGEIDDQHARDAVYLIFLDSISYLSKLDQLPKQARSAT